MSRKQDLPVIVGHGTHTGLICLRSPNQLKGYDLWIVGLNKDYETGSRFGWNDIKWIKAVLHFEDKQAIQNTIEVLQKAISGKMPREDKEHVD